MSACDVAHCGRLAYCRGFCTLHYQRFNRYGDPSVTIRPTRRTDGLLARLLDKIEVGDCWLWTGASGAGYGRVNWRGRLLLAHRVMWEQLVGPIPNGLVIDHLCRVRACVNPDHLEPVTMGENLRRSASLQHHVQTLDWQYQNR